MSTYSENRLITGKKSFTFLKSNVILLKLQKEEKKINRHLDCSKSSPQFRASHKNSLLSLPDKTDAANQSRTIEGVYTIQYVDSSLVYNWYVIIRLGCTHTLALWHQTAWDTLTQQNYCAKRRLIFAVRCSVSWGVNQRSSSSSCRFYTQSFYMEVEQHWDSGQESPKLPF